MASGGSPLLISLYSSSPRDLQCLEGIGPERAERLIELSNRGAFTMAELVVASGKPCVEWRELISAGRVEPFEKEESMLSDPARTPSPPPPTPSAPKPPSTLPDPVASEIERAVTRAISHIETTFREAMAGLTRESLGEVSQIRRSYEEPAAKCQCQ